jgi:hypothetical protein
MGRKYAAIGAAVFALAALPAAASASSVQMLGVIAGPNLISVNANNSPTTSGTVFIIAQNNNTLQYLGNVVCMTVSGNEAYLDYADVTPRGDGTAGGYVRVQDNGPAGVTPVDQQNNGRWSLQGLNKDVAAGCPIPTSGFSFHPLHPINAGEIIVTP